jgi:MSHA pilin protein MshD
MEALLMLLSSSVSRLQNQRGVTLVEMVIAIVIISIAAVALLQGLGFQTGRNVDPMIQSQSQALASQYLDEVLGKSFFDPSNDPRLNPSLSRDNARAGSEDTSARDLDGDNRILFDNVYEYQGYDEPVQNRDGSAIAELAGYQIAITIDNSVGLALGGLTNPGALCPPVVMLVTVTVTDPRGQTTQLQGYRTSYFDRPATWSCT